MFPQCNLAVTGWVWRSMITYSSSTNFPRSRPPSSTQAVSLRPGAFRAALSRRLELCPRRGWAHSPGIPRLRARASGGGGRVPRGFPFSLKNLEFHVILRSGFAGCTHRVGKSTRRHKLPFVPAALGIRGRAPGEAGLGVRNPGLRGSAV